MKPQLIVRPEDDGTFTVIAKGFADSEDAASFVQGVLDECVTFRTEKASTK